jgi:hypothetical protein
MEFASDELRYRFYDDPKKLLVCNHCAPIIDGLWLHIALTIESVSHYIYMGHCFQWGNSWLKPIQSPRFVENEIRSIQSSDQCCPVIFPSGGTMKWKSGFFYIAKSADIPIYIVRLNYAVRKIEVVGRVTVHDHNTFEEVKQYIIARMRAGKYKKPMWWMSILHWFGYGDECMI